MLISAMTFGVMQLALAENVNADTNPQPLPFMQDWTNIGLITVNDNWSMVPGVTGYLGDYTAASPTGVDPRTVLLDMTTVDVIANQTNPDTQTSGGVAEFEITNPVVALQGSGTADAPNLVFYVNTTGASNIRFSCNIRDVDNSVDNAVQPIAVQYRVGATGDFSNVPGGFIADASAGPSMTISTPLVVTLPPQANNQAQVQIRVLTTNAAGSDEWLGIDDVSITANGPANAVRANVDFNGDGRSDYVVTRNTNNPFNEGGASQKFWYISTSGTGAQSVQGWGISSDTNTPADFDGDGKTDIAVWRPSNGVFYILNSATSTARLEQFGQNGDDPRVVGDYDGNGRADLSVYRTGFLQNIWFYRTTPGGNVFYQPWGSGTARPVPGDYDGDGKYDFNVRTAVAGPEQLALLKSTGGVEYINWGLSTDVFVPGDYDGDGKFDFCAVRNEGSNRSWFILERDGGGTGATPIVFGLQSDLLAAADYDGDGRQDVAVWRSDPDPQMNFFYVRNATGAVSQFEWGIAGDTPVAGWWNH